MQYVNVPGIIGAAISSGKATLAELQDIYSVEDVYDMLEIVSIDAHNSKMSHEARKKKGG